MLRLLIFPFFLIICGLIIKLGLNKRLRRLKFHYDSTKNQRDILLKEYQETKDINAVLSGDVQRILELYEITKELTKYLTFDDVFLIFCKCLKEKMVLEDCQFIKSGLNLTGFSDYTLFPLKIDKELMGHLAIKGLRAEDKNKFQILFNQFNLVLKRVNLYAKIEDLSITDSLTGLFLRRYFQERLKEEIVRSHKFGLRFVFLMLDLDHFKMYNDRYGHLVGDVLLNATAGIIKNNVRQIDVVARYGGEEFSVILPDIDREEGEYVSLRICKAIKKKHIRAYDEDLQITVSIGGSVFPEDAKDAQRLIDMADRALYRAKQTGRNRVCFWNEGLLP